MQFKTRKSKVNEIQISHKNDELKETECAKFLGMHLEQNLSWCSHVKYLTNKLNSLNFAMKILSSSTNMETRKVVYHSYFESVVKYGIIFWGNSSKMVKVLTLQKAIVRSMCNANPKESCRPLLKNLNILSIPCLYIYELIIFVHRHPELFAENNFKHEYSTRNKENFMLPTHRLKLFSQTPEYMGMKIYNILKNKKILSTNQN